MVENHKLNNPLEKKRDEFVQLLIEQKKKLREESQSPPKNAKSVSPSDKSVGPTSSSLRNTSPKKPRLTLDLETIVEL